MASEQARQKAAQAWCTEKTKHKEMDTDLAEAFAEILDEYIEAIQALKPILEKSKQNQFCTG